MMAKVIVSYPVVNLQVFCLFSCYFLGFRESSAQKARLAGLWVSITYTGRSNACDGKKKNHETEMIKCGGMFGSAAVTDVVKSPSVRGRARLFGSIWHWRSSECLLRNELVSLGTQTQALVSSHHPRPDMHTKCASQNAYASDVMMCRHLHNALTALLRCDDTCTHRGLVSVTTFCCWCTP